MEILICSDSHGNRENLLRMVKAHPHATHLLFCGDGLRDIEILHTTFPRLITVEVRGNCDGAWDFSDVPTERLLTLWGVKILLMHGHLYGVKGGIGAALSAAKEQEADILLFGHTHIPYDACVTVGEKRVHVFNPGSLGKREAQGYSYGVLTIRENGFLLSHGNC